MLIQSLVEYYDVLLNEGVDIPKFGYETVNVSYVLNLSLEGKLLDVIPLKIANATGKKLVPQPMVLPQQNKRSNGISPNFLCDNAGYVLGLDTKDKPERALQCYDTFKELHHRILDDIRNEESIALLIFLDNWNPEDTTNFIQFEEYMDDIRKGANFVFKIATSNSYLHQNKQIKNAWERYQRSSEQDDTKLCLVSGEHTTIARLHPSIKGIRGSLATGNSLISYNDKSYESFGNEDAQGLNSPIGTSATFAYGTVLNRLLADRKHKLYVGDTTMVFWALSAQEEYADLMSLLFHPSDVEMQPESDVYVDDPTVTKELKNIIENISNGIPPVLSDQFDTNTKFYVLGLSPNAARISVRFYLTNSFGSFVQQVSKHYLHLAIEKQYEKDITMIPIWKLLSETVSPKSKDKDASPLLAGAVLRSILTGTSYPRILYSSVMMRIRAEKNINYYKAAIIKAYLMRTNYGLQNKEVLTLSLNDSSSSKPYILGRLFAVLEKAQLEASPGINTTITDKYFTSACANPAYVFPLLLKLSRHHISKATYGYTSENKIKEILDKLEVNESPFPSNLSLEDQGVFILGFYHQKNSFYKKKEEN